VLLYFIGVVFSGVGFYMLYDAYYFRKYAKAYVGRIIAHKKRISERYTSGQIRYTYYPVVEYNDEQKVRHEFISDMNLQKSSADVGSRVDVLVLGGNHTTARIKQQSRLVLAYAFAIVGPIVLLIGLMMLKESFISYSLWAIALIAVLFYLTQIIVASTRKRKDNAIFPLFEDDAAERIDKKSTPLTSSEAFENSSEIDEQATPQKLSYVRILFASLFFLLALSVLWFGLNQADDVSEKEKKGIKVNGTVMEDKVHREGGMDVHTIVVEYKPIDADPVSVILHKTIAPKLKVGDVVTLTYEPDNYTSVKQYAGDSVINSYVIFILVIGGLLFIIAFIVMPKRAS